MDALLACRVCLSTNTRLHDIHQVNLTETIVNTLGLLVRSDDCLPQYICACCRTSLVKYVDFRRRCDLAQAVLNTEYGAGYMLTTDMIRTIHSTKPELKLPFSIKTTIIDSSFNLATINEYKELDPSEQIDDNYFNDTISTINESTVAKIQLEEFLPIEEAFDFVKSDPDWDNGSISSLSYNSDEALAICLKKKRKKRKRGVRTPRKQYPDHIVLENGIKKKYSNKLDSDPQTIHFNIKMDLNNVEIKKLSHEEMLEHFALRKLCKIYNESKLKCEYCYKGFRKLDTYKNHMIQHDPASGEYVCDICSVRLRTPRAQRVHLRKAHEMKYTCKLCAFSTSYRGIAIEHQDRHRGLQYPCDDCGKVIKKLSNYLSHIRLHREGEHLCSACGKKFLKENGLQTHLRKVHHNLKFKSFIISNEVETQTAKYAEETTTEPVKKKRKRRTKEEMELERDSRSGEKKSKTGGAESVVCETCGSLHRCMAMLKIHQRTHTGEKPHICDVCERPFKTHALLWTHKRTHTKERPYRCIVCEKCFAAKVNLNRHMLVHTGDKPHACNICGKAFSQSNSMKLHIQTVHLKQPWPYKRKRKTPGTNAAMDTEHVILE